MEKFLQIGGFVLVVLRLLHCVMKDLRREPNSFDLNNLYTNRLRQGRARGGIPDQKILDNPCSVNPRPTRPTAFAMFSISTNEPTCRAVPNSTRDVPIVGWTADAARPGVVGCVSLLGRSTRLPLVFSLQTVFSGSYPKFHLEQNHMLIDCFFVECHTFNRPVRQVNIIVIIGQRHIHTTQLPHRSKLQVFQVQLPEYPQI